jgi:hypothetical protein
MKFFSYDPDDGFLLHETEQKAKQHAQKLIDSYRDDAPEGWPDEVEEACWGELRQQAVEIPIDDHSCDYKLVDAI